MTIERNVATPSDVQAAMVERADMVRTLMGGTRAMRKAGTKYLPQDPAESDDAYKARIARSTLFNALGKTVDDMTGKVFVKPVVLKDDVPEAIKALAEDIDRTGRHINVFARDVFYDAMQTGIGFILTEMPPAVQPGGGRAPTVADEKAAGIRPYLVYVPMERLIGWKTDGKTLFQIRILETVTEPDGESEFHEKTVDQVRVIEPGKWRTYRKGADEKWSEHDRGTISLKKIALAPVYLRRTGFMTGAPVLEKLAEKNVEHWQSASDQRNILHVARVPILFGTCFEEDDELKIGASNMIRNGNKDAKLQYVEHGGQAIGAGRDDLKDLEFQMQTMGLQLLVPNPGQTATGEVRDDAKENSPLAMMAMALQDALEMSFGFMAEFMGLGEDAGGSIEVNKDFGVQAAGGADLQHLIAAGGNRTLSKETVWAEMQRRGFLSDSFDPDVEKDRLESEAPELDAAPGRAMDLETA